MPNAARIGDQTSHGTPLAPGPGSPNVLIGSKPAWRATSDAHTCPLIDVLKPHGGGTIIVGSKTVFINKLPAARVGDFVTEVGPPNAIVSGHPTVIIGDSSTVSPPPTPEEIEDQTIDLVGQIRDNEGNPLKNTPIKIVHGKDGSLFRKVTTDNQGRYEVLDIPEGDYDILVDAEERYGGNYGETTVRKGLGGT